MEANRTISKRERTRQSLVQAARELIETRSHKHISIQDITDKADVGLGTFYNYFDNKQMAFEAVLQQMRVGFEERLECLRSGLTDPAARIAATMQFCFNEALDNEEWRTLVERSGLEGEYLLLQDADQCHMDIEIGAKRGRFKIDNPVFVASLIQGMVQHVTREIMADRLDRSAIPDTTRYILRMLGLPELVAKAVTQAPLPPVAAQKRRVVKEILPHLERTAVDRI